MSFASTVKEEVTNLDLTRPEKISELSGFIRSTYKISDPNRGIYTENTKIAKMIYSFLKEVYSVKCEILVNANSTFNKRKTFNIIIHEKLDFILEDLSVVTSKGEFILTPKDYIASSEDEIRAYIRGAFFACGSINDPKTSQYHLEFLFDYKEEAVFIQRLLNEFDLNAKLLLREKKIMVYIKDSDDISDFLKIIGASNAVMYYENVRAMKEQINITNRLNNCEQANTDKILMTSNEQIKEINYILSKLDMDLLDDKIQEIINYRLEYPESSLSELSEIISMETNKKITKSGLNHRFRKIKEIYNRLKDN